MRDSIDAMLANFWEEAQLAHGLPPDAYLDEEFWKIERSTVFANSWVCVGFAHELVEAGDTIPVIAGGAPLVLLKNQSGEILAFHNMCRHRCLKLIDEPKNVGKLIRCPYHAWAYTLDGALHATPQFGGKKQHEPDGFDRAEHGLKPVRVAIWHDWIFVNLSGDAPPFQDYARPLIKRLEGIDFNFVRPVATLDFGEVETNWKFLMENFIEPYHVPFVHRTTTDQPLKEHSTFVDGVCIGSAADLIDEDATSLGSLAVTSRYLTLFPNFVIGHYLPDQLGVHLNVPIGPGRTAQKRVIYTTEGRELHNAEIEGLKALWWAVHEEDHEMCKRLQLGRTSYAAQDGGVLSPYWENGVRAFQELVAVTATKGTGRG